MSWESERGVSYTSKPSWAVAVDTRALANPTGDDGYVEPSMAEAHRIEAAIAAAKALGPEKFLALVRSSSFETKYDQLLRAAK